MCCCRGGSWCAPPPAPRRASVPFERLSTSLAGGTRGDDYPEAQRLLDTSLVVNHEARPIDNQGLELMGYDVEAFRKGLGHLDERFAG